ncbi:TIGR00366 family protein [Chitinophagales bacterium]|nr:TIGR00366 family protein [Chitinophagales bacterium]
MSFSEKFVGWAHYLLPSPFSIAVIITLFSILLALLLTEPIVDGPIHLLQVLGHWEDGFFSLLSFTMQMILILVLGHVLALSKPINLLIDRSLSFCNNTASAAFLVTLFTVIMALFNWGLGLIFGAIFARKIGENMKKRGIAINYPLIGAAAYSGLMVWHGGLSGSAPADVAGKNHQLVDQIGVLSNSATIFSTMNSVVSVVLLIVLPCLMYFLGKRALVADYTVPSDPILLDSEEKIQGADRIDYSSIVCYLLSALFFVVIAMNLNEMGIRNFFTLNNIIWSLFAFGFLFHGNFKRFIVASERAIGGSTGILIQFPLYAGIIGIMKGTGLLALFSDAFVSISTATTFPFFAFLSAGLVNVFVPSGGGQWAVQGPIIVTAAQELGVPISKAIMALVYGDQLTNMLQPFWALPLLGITGLKAKEILPYTFILFLAGLVIFSLALAVF